MSPLYQPQHNVTPFLGLIGKLFPCPVCYTGLPLKLTRKEKPYCMCLECGIQLFFRGQTGIHRLAKLVDDEERVAIEFSGHVRAISLYNRLQGLKRQKQRLEDRQWPIFGDADLDKVIEALDEEIKRVRIELGSEERPEKEQNE